MTNYIRISGGYQMTVEFFGITPGIADTSVFNEPAQCVRIVFVFLFGETNYNHYAYCIQQFSIISIQ